MGAGHGERGVVGTGWSGRPPGKVTWLINVRGQAPGKFNIPLSQIICAAKVGEY